MSGIVHSKGATAGYSALAFVLRRFVPNQGTVLLRFVLRHQDPPRRSLLRLVSDLLFSIFANSNLPAAVAAAALYRFAPSPATGMLWRQRPLTAAQVSGLVLIIRRLHRGI